MQQVGFFPSRWPIMCAVMNGASDLKLACAVYEAGAMPSLVIAGDHREDVLHTTLDEFVKFTGSANVVLQLNYQDIINPHILKIVGHFRVSHIELFGGIGAPGVSGKNRFDYYMKDPEYASGLAYLESFSKIMIRIVALSDYCKVSAYGVKGKDSAGFGGELSVSDMFDRQKELTPTLSLIPYGGVGTPAQVADYIKRGAAGVAVGTLFAATKESCLADTVKQKMISADSESLVKFSNSQQALVLGDLDQIMEDQTPNRQNSLEAGIAGRGGFVYAGSAINQINEIRTVKQVVDYLVQDIIPC